MAVRIGLIGLGIMGSAYARHLVAAGFAVTGYDVDAAALRDFAASGGRAADAPKAVAAESDVLISALPSLDAMERAFFGPGGVAAGASPALIVLEAGTFPLAVKERVRAGLAERGARVLDTPVSGTGSQARIKDLVFFASGERAAFDASREVMAAVSRDVRYVGEFGNGSKLKYIANLLVTTHNAAAAEAVVLAEKSGLDPKLMVEIIGESAAASRMFQVRAPMMVERAYEPAAARLEMYDKDVEIIGAFAKSVGCPVPLFEVSALFYTAALAQGRGKQDTAAIVSVLRQMAGLAAE